MNKKILNIKNILRIIISILVIFSMLKSCSMAYNIDDLYEYSMQIKNMKNVPSRVTYCANRIIDNYWQLKDIEVLKNCKSIFVQDGASSTEIFYWNDTYKISFTSDGNALWGLPNTSQVYMPDGTSYIRYADNRGFTQSPQKSIGLLDLSLNTKDEIEHFPWDNGNWYLNNRYDEPSHFIYTPYNITTIDDYNILKFTYTGNVAIGRLGENDFYQLQVRLKDSSLTTLGTALFNENQECYYRDNALIVENNQDILANTIYLSYKEPYYLEFTIYSDSTNYEIQGHLYKFYPQNAVIENGQIVSTGSGDYTNQDATIQNQNFFTKLYDNMFTVESGEAKEIIDEYIAKTDISEYGLESGEKQILNVLTGEPSDFIISWNEIQAPNMGYNTQTSLIKSGSVNLSKLILTYDNVTYSPQNKEAILNVINIARTIMGYTIMVLVMANMWETLCRVLGIGVGMYESNEEEKARLETQVTVEEFNNLDNNRGYTVVTAYDPKTRNRRKYYTKK